MDPIKTLLSAIKRIKEPRFFLTERGYQGQLASEFDKLLDAEPATLDRPIVEQEYQKRAKAHGIRLRPDIIVHIPYERGVSPTRRHDNYLVILLKLSATQRKSEADFNKLSTICSILDYPIGVFVNVASTDLWLPHFADKFADKANNSFVLHEFAVSLNGGHLHIRASAG